MALKIRNMLFIVVLIVLLTGCLQNGVPETPGTTEKEPAASSPPEIILHIDDLTQEGVLLGYCWKTQDGNASICADPLEIGRPTAAEPLVVSPVIEGWLEINFSQRPNQQDLTIYPVDPQNIPTPEPNGWVYWKPAGAGRTLSSLPVESPPGFTVELEAGLYVFGFSLSWDDFGEATYSFLVAVE